MWPDYGPMRGIPDFNFPAFDQARDYVNSLPGYKAVSPADIDRDAGLDTMALDIHAVPQVTFEECMRRDLEIVAKAHAVLLLAGWENSRGANNELFVANACGVEVWGSIYVDSEVASHFVIPDKLDPPLLTPKDEEPEPEIESVLTEANRLIHGDRQGVYGHPYHDFTRTATMWSGYKGIEFTPEDVAAMMIQVKLSRLANSPGHRDSVVDIAGYAGTLEMVQEYRHGVQEGYGSLEEAMEANQT